MRLKDNKAETKELKDIFKKYKATGWDIGKENKIHTSIFQILSGYKVDGIRDRYLLLHTKFDICTHYHLIDELRKLVPPISQLWSERI